MANESDVVAIERAFKERVSNSVRLASEGLERFRVFTPFMLDDGDHLAIVLKRDHARWVLSDEGHTFMHLTYEMDERDLQRGTRLNVIQNALAAFSVEDREGELRLEVPDDLFGDALYSFVQALLKISDVTYLSRERVKSTFMEDFRKVFTDLRPVVGEIQFDWHHPQYDPDRNYVVDCRIETRRNPLLVYALPSDDRVRDATIGLHQFERWRFKHQSMGIFESQESVNRKVLARFSDVCDKQFSNLVANRERIEAFVADATTAVDG